MGCQGTFQKITKLQACGGLLGNNSNSCGAVWGWVQINPVTVFPAPVWAHRLILGQAGLWLERQCVLAYAGLFSNERKKSVAESVRKTKGLSGAFWGARALFQKVLKIIGLGRFFRPERRPLQTLRPIIYRPARAYCQRMLSSRRAFRIATGGPNAPRHSRICATLWIGAGR